MHRPSALPRTWATTDVDAPALRREFGFTATRCCSRASLAARHRSPVPRGTDGHSELAAGRGGRLAQGDSRLLALSCTACVLSTLNAIPTRP